MLYGPVGNFWSANCARLSLGSASGLQADSQSGFSALDFSDGESRTARDDTPVFNGNRY